MKSKHIILSQVYGAMVSWTHLVEKTIDSNGVMNHLTGLCRGKNTDGNSLTNPLFTSILLVDCVTKNRLITTLKRKKKKKIYCHDNDMKYFTNIIICGSV